MTGDNFAEKWREVLRKVVDRDKYDRLHEVGPSRELPTRDLPAEAQEHIDSRKRAITKPDVLVLNRPYDSFLRFNGSRRKPKSPDEIEYFRNIERLLAERSKEKIDALIFDYPELYALDSSERLAQGEIESVVLTPYSSGGSLFENRAYREIGGEKRIFLAGGQLGCLATTAEELFRDYNNIILIEDAAFLDGKLSSHLQGEFLNECDIDSCEFTTTAEFLRRFGK